MRFENASLAEAIFSDVDLSAARLADVTLAGASFSDVCLAGARFDDVDFSHVAITDSKLEGMTIDGILVSDLLLAYRDSPVVPTEKLIEADAVLDLKTFVPAKDHDLAKQFYVDLGFRLNWGNDQVAEFEVGSFRFLLQNFHAPQFAENFMMHLMVDDADAWWKRIEEAGLAAKYPGIMLKPPAVQPWGLRVLYLTDPTGVLWHIADRRTG